jgi:rhodanese-related sulfurtransferase
VPIVAGAWSAAVEVCARESVRQTIASLRADGVAGPALVFGQSANTQDDPRIVQIERRKALRVQLSQRFGLGVITAEAWQQSPIGERRALVHNLVAHLLPGALVWVQLEDSMPVEPGEPGSVELIEHALACGLEQIGPSRRPVFRRTARTTIHDLVAQARAQLVRTTPHSLAQRLRHDPDCVVLDTRTSSDRARFGTIPGSRHLPRSTLEWRVDPASGYSQEGVSRLDQCLVVVCTDGYSSSLAAVSLQRLGFVHATDLIGGFTAWCDAGMPVVATADSTAGVTLL